MGNENPNIPVAPDPHEPQPLSALIEYIPSRDEPAEKAIDELNRVATERARNLIADRKMDAVMTDRADEERQIEKKQRGEGDMTEPEEPHEPEEDVKGL